MRADGFAHRDGPLRVAMVCATLNRPTGLNRLEASMPDDVALIVRRETQPRPLHERLGELMRRAFEQGYEAIGWLNDDCEVLPGCFEAVRAAFREHGSTDLAVGLNQTNIPSIPNCTEFGYMVLGREFLERFFGTGQGPFCPDYHHFYTDTELGLFAKELGRFAWREDAQILHHHQALAKETRDATFYEARKHIERDKETWRRRQQQGLLWGRGFEVIHGDG